MTTVADLLAPLPLDPDAPRPPFPLVVDLPAGWAVLDTHPGTWRRSAEQLVDALAPTRLTKDERRQILSTLEDLVSRCQRGGVSVSLVVLGRLQPGTAFSAGLHLAFAEVAGQAGLGAARDLAGRSGVATEIDGPHGPFLLHRSRSTMLVPGTASVVGLTHLQVFVPVPDSSWMAVASTSTPHEELVDPLERVVTAVAAGLVRADSDSDSEAEGGDEPDVTEEIAYEAVDPTPMPGLGRGFGTMVRRTLADPGDGTTE